MTGDASSPMVMEEPKKSPNDIPSEMMGQRRLDSLRVNDAIKIFLLFSTMIVQP